MDAIGDQQKHFVLVHGSCHGAWCWFKLKPLLEVVGHRVSVFDLSASGTDTKQIQQVKSLCDYTSPLLELMATISSEEKVVLVGHSFGGMSIALAMEKFPKKVAVAVFLTAFMPDSLHKPSYVLEKKNYRTPVGDALRTWLYVKPLKRRVKCQSEFSERTPIEARMDIQLLPYDNENESEISMCFGPKYLSYKLYQLCSDEDRELGRILIRPGSSFSKDLGRTALQFTEKGYNSVQRVYIICDKDEGIRKEFQQWMIDNNPVAEVKELNGVDHMPMLCDPKQLSVCLLDIALRYA